LGYVLGNVLSQAVGWRETLGWVGGPGLLLAFVLLPFREPQRGALDADQLAAEGGAASMSFGSMTGFWKERYYRVALAAGVSIALAVHFTIGKDLANLVLGPYQLPYPRAALMAMFVVSYAMFVFFLRQMLP